MKTILIVSGCERQAGPLETELRREGFGVVVVDSAHRARAALGERNVALAIVDLDLRGGSCGAGLELAREISAAHPELRVVLTGACHLSERQLERIDCRVSGFLPKPFRTEGLGAFLHAKLEAPPSSSRRLWHAEIVPPAALPSSAPGARATF